MSSLERFARIRAAIEQGGDRNRVLRDEGLAPAEWIQLQRRWLDALAAEIASGGDTLATRYCQAFEAVLSHAHVAEQPVAPTDAPEVEEASVHVPSYLKAPSIPLPIAPAPQPSPIVQTASPVGTDLRGTALAFEVPRMPAVPFKQGPAPPSIAASPAPKPSPSIHSGTVLTLDVPRGPAMPFAVDRDAAGGPGAAAGSGRIGAPPASTGPATPVGTVESDALGFNLMRYADLVAARGEPGTETAAVLAEFEIDAEAHARIEDYWRRKFADNGLLALDFGRLLSQAKKARAEKRAPRPAAPFGTGTALALDTASGPLGAQTKPAGPATPFEALEPEALGFNLMRYADLVAARSEPGVDMAAVLAEFGIDADAHDRIEAYWRRKFSENGLLALDFGRLNAQAKKARPDRRAPRPAASVGTGTSLALEVPRSAIPFPAAANEAGTPPATPAAIPELNVEQYAWIVASLRKTTDVPATLARFRLTPESRKELEARWAKRMAADPALREAFLAALGRHLGGGTG